ncbi:histamine H2 receptor-like, partial [Actinia tenebrosa]|uniref:Histamine H2 receptor-like n=1 Tax=Actinia tenebrosa TaxID=6105 RepID=A0A6P8HMF8_ACTTE
MSNDSVSGSCVGVSAPRYLSILTTTVSLGLTLVTVPGNSLICYAILKDPFHELRTPFTFLILSLAMTDLLVGILMDPISTVFHLSEALKIDLVDIRVLHISYFILSTASILSLGALTIDRYVAVIYPLKYKSYLSTKKCIYLSLVIWLVSIGLSMVYFKFGYIFYSLIFASTAVLLTFLVLLFVYVSIFNRLRKQVRSLSRQRASSTQANRVNKKKISSLKWEAKVTKALVLVLLAYILCFAPACIIIYVLNF